MPTILKGSLATGTTNPNPVITCWEPVKQHTGIGVIICPGGGYAALARHEGQGYAERLSEAGIACFVVTYRLGSAGHRHPEMLEDALAAIETIRTKAADFGIDPGKLGIMGSSAGGHLAAHTLVSWETYNSVTSLRPDFGILCYPVITTDPSYSHKGSIRNLLGEAPSEALSHTVSCEKHVSRNTPPCFLWHTVEDEAVPVENSLLFAQALRHKDVPFEMHIYPHGEHGLGLDTPFDWGTPCIRWIHSLFQAPRMP